MKGYARDGYVVIGTLVPLVDVGAHNEPSKDGYAGSLQFDVPADVIDRYDAVPLEARQGDLILCHMDLVHRSGTNGPLCQPNAHAQL